MQLMKWRLFKLNKVYTLKIDETGEIEYLETNEVLEDIYKSIEQLQEQMLEILVTLRTNETENNLNISKEDIVF